MKRAAIIFVLAALTAIPAAAQDAGTVSPFTMGAGARELSLGSASGAVSSFVTAPFWNPSRLSMAEQLAVGAFHSRLYDAEATYQYLGVVVPTLDFGSFGAGVFRLGVSDIEERDADNVLLGHFEDNRLAIFLSYGRSMSGYEIGLSTTMEYHSLGEFTTTSSPGMNLTVSKRFTPEADWLGGVTAMIGGRNLLSPTLVLDQSEVSYPAVFDANLAVAMVPKPIWNHRLTLFGRVWKTESVDPKLAFGVEYSIVDMVHLRGGLNEDRPAVGVGLSWSAVEFDYAVIERDLGNLHMVSLTTSFGAPVSVRRQQRVRHREEEFNRLMSEQLIEQNRSLVTKLVSQGREAYELGDLSAASEYLDRAMFLAPGNEVDTTEIAVLRSEVLDQLRLWEQANRLADLLDSAAARLNGEDYLTARHFASLAASEYPESDSALALLSITESTLNQLAARQEFVESKLSDIDSLLSYGDLDQALLLVNTLEQAAPDHSRIRLIGRRVRFEQYRSQATAALAQSDWAVAETSLDSMDAAFPDNRRSLDLRNRLQREQQAHVTAVDKAAEVKKPVPISEKLQEEVGTLYEQAQTSFKNGQLAQAIERWEEVERLAPDFRSVRDHLTDAYKFVGIDLYGSNKLAEAVAVWEKAIRLRPDRAEISNYLNRARSELTKIQQLSYE